MQHLVASRYSGPPRGHGLHPLECDLVLLLRYDQGYQFSMKLLQDSVLRLSTAEGYCENAGCCCERNSVSRPSDVRCHRVQREHHLRHHERQAHHRLREPVSTTSRIP